jgi:tetratricopeptide (TPR) repeat protein
MNSSSPMKTILHVFLIIIACSATQSFGQGAGGVRGGGGTGQPSQPVDKSRTRVPASSGKGRPVAGTQLTISSDPAACQVFINEQLRGVTDGNGNLILRLSPGRYKVRLTRDGFQAQERMITLSRSNEERFSLPPTYVMMRITIEPQEAEVYLDGEYKGITRTDGWLMIPQVRVGAHLLRVERKGYFSKEQTVTAAQDVPVRVKLDADPIAQRIKVVTEKVEARKLEDALDLYTQIVLEKPDHRDLPDGLNSIARALLVKSAQLLNQIGPTGLVLSAQDAADIHGMYERVRKWAQTDSSVNAMADYWALKYYEIQARQASTGAEKDAFLQNQAGAMSRLMALNPTDAVIVYDLGWYYYRLNDRHTTEQLFMKAQINKPNWAFTYYALGRLDVASGEQQPDKKTKLGRYTRAIESLARAINLNPSLALAYAERCIAYARIKKRVESINDGMQAISLSPQSAYAHYALGFAYYLKGKSEYPNAQREFEAALAAPVDALDQTTRTQVQQMLTQVSKRK